ncbi:MAG: hypothetical protein K2I64_02150 [Muribaculaceae bacterium]|nr:hypothetical protein [Muribaculaceae bacterium]
MNYTRLFFIAITLPLIPLLFIKAEGDTPKYIYFGTLAIVVLIEIIYIIRKKAIEREEVRQMELTYQRELALARQAKERYEEWITAYKVKNGTPDIVFTSPDYDLNEVFIFNSSNGTIYLKGRTYSFNDILGYQIKDSSRTIPGATTAVTQRHGVFRRAIIGSMIADNAGAIIGALTAPETTEYYEEEDTIIHDYTLSVNINDLAHPLVRYNIGDNLEIAEQIAARLNVILERKKLETSPEPHQLPPSTEA